MTNVSVAIQMARELERRGWEPEGGVVFDKPAGGGTLRCKLKGQRALFYTVGFGFRPNSERFTSVYYKEPNAIAQLVATMARLEAEAGQ